MHISREVEGEVWVVADLSLEKLVWLDLSCLWRGLWRWHKVRESGGWRHVERVGG